MKTNLWPIAVVLLACCSALGQGPVYKLNQDVVLTVTFEGKDASKVSSGTYVFRLDGNRHDDQAGFNTDFNCGAGSRVVVTGTIEMICKVKSNQASGEYKLLQLNISFSEIDNAQVSYAESEFPARKITIRNDTTLIKPTIKDVQVH
ncbi:MAG: hypothetical protein WCC37_20010 [Candidatus Sulfotelmatobacter sp.]|jgi:hypothetical protein